MAADPDGGRGRAGQRPRASGGAAGPVAGLAADRGDRARGRGPVAQRGRPCRPGRRDGDDQAGIRQTSRPSPGASHRTRGHRLAQRRRQAVSVGSPIRSSWLGTARVAGSGAAIRPVAAPSRRRPARPLARVEAAGPKGRFLLWVDAVGGYLVCLDDRIVLGRAGPDSHADVPLMGDLSRNHATLVRNGEGYLLQAHHASFVNGKPVVDQAVLHDGDVIRLGSTVELEFRQPSPVSATARLSIVSRHRLPLAVDGVLLMAETCIVGEALERTSRPRPSRTRSSSTARLARSGAGPPAL